MNDSVPKCAKPLSLCAKMFVNCSFFNNKEMLSGRPGIHSPTPTLTHPQPQLQLCAISGDLWGQYRIGQPQQCIRRVLPCVLQRASNRSTTKKSHVSPTTLEIIRTLSGILNLGLSLVFSPHHTAKFLQNLSHLSVAALGPFSLPGSPSPGASRSAPSRCCGSRSRRRTPRSPTSQPGPCGRCGARSPRWCWAYGNSPPDVEVKKWGANQGWKTQRLEIIHPSQ